MTAMGMAPAPDADVIVIGAGPAGMSAAIAVAKAGRSVIVLDLQPSPGGQVFRGLKANLAALPGTDGLLAALGPTYLEGAALIGAFRSVDGIDYRPETSVWDLRADGTVGWQRGKAAGYLRAGHVVLANGAAERAVPFPGWTLPGVMTAGAVQTLIKAGRLKPEGRIVLAGTGPLILLLAEQLRRLGVKPVLIARTDRLADSLRAFRHVRPAGVSALLKGLGWLLRLRLARVPMLSGICDLRAEGLGHVETVGFTIGARRVVVPCDLLVVHDGIVPAIDLAHGAGLALTWDAAGANWCPRTGPDGAAELAAGQRGADGACRIRISGDARGIGGADVAMAHGRLAGLAVVAALEGAGSADFAAAKWAVQHAMIPRAFIDAAFPVGIAASLPGDATIICRCEEITAGTLRAHIRAGLRDINQIRGLTRCGMGACQGRSCTVTLARLIAEDGGRVPQDPLPFRARPPLRPLSLGALANLTGCDPALAEALALDDKPQAVAEDEPHAAAR